jgi:molecular chaperone DnaK
MKEKANTLAQSAMKMGQAIYEQEQASGAAAGGAAEEAPADDNVVDAEFSEVDEDKKD